MDQHQNFKPDIIDLESIIRKSNSRFFKSMPRFLVVALKRIIREQELNRIHNTCRDKTGFEYIEGLINEFGVKLIVNGIDAVPKEGRYVYVANHPQGGLDAVSFLCVIHRHHGDVVSPSNQLFEYVPNLRPFIVGINVFGKNTKEKAEMVNDAFSGNRPVMIFPSGEVSRKSKNGKIEDPEWHKTFVSKTTEFKRTIVPVHISGRNSRMFYCIARLRKSLGIRMYIETMLLPREMLKQKGSVIRITVGKPISWKELDKSKTHAGWAEEIRNMVYSLNEISD